MIWIESTAATVVTFLSNSLLPGLLLALFTTALFWLYRKANASTKYAVWYLCLLGLLITPLLMNLSINPNQFFSTPTQSIQVASENRETSPSVIPLNHETPPSSTSLTLSNEDAQQIKAAPIVGPLKSSFKLDFSSGIVLTIGVLWLVGVFIGLLKLIQGLKFLRHLKLTSKASDDQIKLDSLISSHSIRRTIELKTSNKISVPMSLGFLRPIILIPATLLNQLTKDELNHILLHELAHLKRRDDWTKLLQKLIRTFFFFHPAVWWIDRQLDFEREVACDNWVIQHQQPRKDYALNLIKIAEQAVQGKHEILASTLLEKKTLQRRVIMILDNTQLKENRFGKLKLTSVFIVLFIFVTAISQTIPSLGIANEETASDRDNSSALVFLKATRFAREEPITVEHQGRTFEIILDLESSYEKINLQDLSNEVIVGTEDVNSQPLQNDLKIDPQNEKIRWVLDMTLTSISIEGSDVEAFEYFSAASHNVVTPRMIDFEIHSGTRMFYAVIAGHGIVVGGTEGGVLIDLVTKEDVTAITGDPFPQFTEIELDEVNGKIYFFTTTVESNLARFTIARANLDGSNLEHLSIIENGFSNLPHSLLIDSKHESIYWLRDTAFRPIQPSIVRANLDGSGVEEVLNFDRNDVITNLTLDSSTGALYWALKQGDLVAGPTPETQLRFLESLDTKIQRLRLNSSEIETLLSGKFDFAGLTISR